MEVEEREALQMEASRGVRIYVLDLGPPHNLQWVFDLQVRARSYRSQLSGGREYC